MAEIDNDTNQEKVKKIKKLSTAREKADQSISVHDYPSLGLGKDEYIVADVERSKIGLVFIWSVIVVLSLLAMFICQVMIWWADSFGEVVLMVLIGYVGVIITLIIGSAESRIYRRNYMIISNQRAFMQTQVGPFATKNQVIELQNIEDVTVYQKGILQSIPQ